jgi:hypothetical protein
MNYYNIQYSPKNENNTQRIIYNKKIKIYSSRIIKHSYLNLNNEIYKRVYKNH